MQEVRRPTETFECSQDSPELFSLGHVFDASPREPEWRSWLWVGAWSLLIFAAVPFARSIRSFVSEYWSRALFGHLTLLTIAAAGVWSVRYLRRSAAATVSSYGWLVAVVAIFVAYTIELRDAPEEALHFVQYGFLGFLAFRALSHRIRDPAIYPVAIVIGVLVAVVDEAIQWLTPRRFWDLRDLWIDGLGTALVQLGIAKGIRPKLISGRPQPHSIRWLCRLGLALTVLLGLTLLNTPQRIGEYTRVLPALGFLRHNESMMLEYGYRHEDAETGPFHSRFSVAEIARHDLERGREVAETLDRYRDDSEYQRFLELFNPTIDPFAHEARVHLFRRDKHLAWADEPQKSDYERRVHLSVAFKENRLMEKYFHNTLAWSSYPLAPETAAVLEANRLPDEDLPAKEVESRVSRHLVTVVREPQILALLGLFIVGLSLIDRRFGGQQAVGGR